MHVSLSRDCMMLFKLALDCFVLNFWISGIYLKEYGVLSSRPSATSMTLSRSAIDAIRIVVITSGRLAESTLIILISLFRTKATAKKKMNVKSPFF